MKSPGPVLVCAGGASTRIREMLDAEGLPPDYPKHLLPTGGPDHETLLGRIVKQASQAPINQPPIIYAAPQTVGYMQRDPSVGPATFSTEAFNFSVDPLYYRLRKYGQRVLGCAGDFYSDFTWAGFISEHDRRETPMSVLAGPSAGSPNAAIYEVEDGVVTNFYRPEGGSDPTALKNIGAYIIDPDPRVMAVLDELLPVNPAESLPDDTIFNRLVMDGLVGAITNVGSNHFNVNSVAEYQDMLQRLSEPAQSLAS